MLHNEKGERPGVRALLPTCLFCAFIGVLSLLFFCLPKEEYSAREKRVLEKTPQFSFQTLFDGSYGKAVDNYLSDHFADRKFWVGLNAQFLLLTGRNGASGVYAGNDGYLINLPVAPDGKKVEKNVGKCVEFARKTGLPARMMIVPSTGYVLSGELPAVHEEYRDAEILSAVRSKAVSPLVYVDLEQEFLKNSEKPLYYKTDHHWTSQGAYLAYTVLCGELGLSPAPQGSFHVLTYPGFYGTTYAKAGLWNRDPDTLEVWQGDESGIRVTVSDGQKSDAESDSMFFLKNASGDDPYTAFLSGNHSLVRITNKNASSDRKLLLVKDSFAHCLAPFLAAHYAEIDLVDLRYYKLSLSELAKERGLNEILFLYGLDSIVNDTNFSFLR